MKKAQLMVCKDRRNYSLSKMRPGAERAPGVTTFVR